MRTPSSYNKKERIQTEDSFMKMILEYVEQQLSTGTSRESIRKELMLSGFDEESVELVTEVAESNCQVRYVHKRNQDMVHGLFFALAGMVLLYNPMGMGMSTLLLGGLLLIAGLLLMVTHLPEAFR
ncbi:hypothetical protein AB9P05_13965 [Roseivirga sp. BDSF3-8]|uniref:hypothetical protein n=1 Tax=Roseivirga sp. BDSF3-8 TaxID=3241598 RepID=UPI00353257F3